MTPKIKTFALFLSYFFGLTLLEIAAVNHHHIMSLIGSLILGASYGYLLAKYNNSLQK